MTFCKQPTTDKIPKVDISSLPETNEAMPVQNILVWLHDAVSRNNFIYSLPKTWALLESLLEENSGKGGFLLTSHNILGRNTHPNIVPLFTGYRQHEWQSFKNRTREFTDSQFLFRRFEHAGSVTALYEDAQDSLSPPKEAWTPTGYRTERPGHYYSQVYMKKRFRFKKEWIPHCISEISSNMVRISIFLPFVLGVGVGVSSMLFSIYQ